MWALVSEPLPVRLQLNFAYNNLRSEYHVVLRREDFSSFGELYRLVRDYDRPRRRMQPRTPVTPNESVMPELAYQPDRYTPLTLPLLINSEMRPVEVRVIPKLNYDMILGMDAIAAFEICYDGQTGRWWTKRSDDIYDWNSKTYLDGRDVA
ncbi:hypothetical protein KQX54_009127 [Cotesia glomerata]|uniref:Uncharacterized protein n=1 Tax=Cotesia glomerata TaxID=32391 RepID=A0AAV7HX70_COTGL|nr:hypothetical protein KQX54_009127 [Cotesia glomerata]